MTQPAPLRAPIDPVLSLVEEVVLLSLGASRVRTRHAARIAAEAHPGGPSDYQAAVTCLAQRGMLSRTGVRRAPIATPGAQLPAREARVGSIIRRPAPPAAEDAELLVLLAAARALTFPGAGDHMQAHARVASIGQNGTIPPAVHVLARELGAATMRELADRLLPPTRADLADADFAGIGNRSAASAYGAGAV